MTLTVGVSRERDDGRVALTPDGVRRVTALGLEVVVTTGAGLAAFAGDSDYAESGARVTDERDVCATSDILLGLHPPSEAQLQLMHPGQTLIGLLDVFTKPALALRLAEAKVIALSLTGLPRTLPAAQSMDALTSQANVSGYKAAIVAADTYGGYLPMLMTAAGTVRPATVLVVGAGVAGLQAIGTARRLGAVVAGYDVRAAARADVLSTGARFLELDPGIGAEIGTATGAGGYAAELTPAEHAAQQAALVKAISSFDIVITTAQVPGRQPPLLVPATALAGMRPGSVIVDLASGDLGGNVEGSKPDHTIVIANGITVIGAGKLASLMPAAASNALSRNMSALLAHLVTDGELRLDISDAITAGILITRDGEVVHPDVVALLPPTRDHS